MSENSGVELGISETHLGSSLMSYNGFRKELGARYISP